LFYSTRFVIFPPLKDPEAGEDGLSGVYCKVASHIPDKDPVMICYYD